MNSFTRAHRWLAAGFVLFGAALAPIAFTVMLITVTRLLRPSFGWWAWAVPVGTEAGFLGFFCADLLAEWRRRPLKILRAAPYLLAAVSLGLNALAGRSDPAFILGHAALPVVFFGYVVVAELLVRRLAVTDDERATEVALKDAAAMARDLLRERLGVFWRLRAPSLLRRQIRAGRFPSAVRQAAETRYGPHDALEKAVTAWMAASLTRGVKVAAEMDAARRAAVPQPDPAPGASVPQPSRPAARPSPSRSRPAGAQGRRDEVRRLLQDEPSLTQGQIAERLGVVRSTVERDVKRMREAGELPSPRILGLVREG